MVFAPHPLSTTPQAIADVPIHAYVTGQGIDWSQVAGRRDFAGVDVDAWAYDLFALIDRVLSPTLAIPAAALGARDGQDHLAPIRDAQRRLAASLRTLAIPLFAASDPSGRQPADADAAAVAAAQEAFEQALLAQLSNAFAPVGPVWCRAIPDAPSMVAQYATRSAASAGAPEASGRAHGSAFARWDFAFTYSRPQHLSPQHLSQDLIQGKVRFNRCETRRAAKGAPGTEHEKAKSREAGTTGATSRPTTRAAAAAGGSAEGANSADAGVRDLLRELALAVLLLPDISRDLTRWLAPLDAATTDETALANARAALQAFATLAVRLADRWTTIPGPPAEAGAMRGGGPDTYGFAIRERAVTIDGKPALLVTIHGGPPPGLGDPRIEIAGYKATPHPVADGDGCGYVYVRETDDERLDPGTACGIEQRTLVLPGLDLLARQDACASLQVARNAALLDDRRMLTAEPFVYRTEWVRFVNAIQPTIDLDEPIDIASLEPASAPPSGPAATPAGADTSARATASTPATRPLAQHLSALFAAIFRTDPLATQLVQLDVRYAHAIAAGLSPVELPVLQQPLAPLRLPADYQVPDGGCARGGDDQDPRVCQLAAALRAWFDGARPAGTDGTLWFDLIVFTTLNDTPTPLLRVRRAALDLRHVDPPLPVS